MRKKSFFICMATMLLVFLAAVCQGESLTPQLVKQKAKEAAQLIQAEGEAAFDKLKDPKSEFRFADGAGYIWVHDLDAVMLMHPIKPDLDGKNLGSMRDINGVYLFLAMNELVEAHGEGWVPYMWPKPGEKESSPKVSYVVLVKHGDKSFVAGCGMYDVTPAEIKAEFPSDSLYVAD